MNGNPTSATPGSLAEQAFERSPLGMLITDAKAVIQRVNPSFARITGYETDEVLGRNPRILQSRRHDREFYRALWRRLVEGGVWEGEIWDRRKDGEIYPEFLSITALVDASGAIQKYLGVFRDISSQKRAEERLRELAYFDALTGLPNRALLADRIERALSSTRRFAAGVALLYIDLDGFKEVNDRHGHEVGDRALELIGECITMCLRSSDTVARVGGDEFVALLVGVRDRAEAARIARKIVESLGTGVVARGREVRVGASVGIAMFPEDAGDPRDLLRMADDAMYAVKKRGKHGYRLHVVAPEPPP